MQLNKILQGDYTLSSLNHQIKLPLDIELSSTSDDPVRLVSAFVEEMDLSDLYETYDRIRKNQASPRQMLKIVIYATMNRIYSSRDVESSCKRDINFMYLLDGAHAPDHSTIARFISMHLSQCSRQIMSEVGTILLDLGEISGENIFIDGTKIESVANKYTFVWKNTVSKNMIKLGEKISVFCAECEECRIRHISATVGTDIYIILRIGLQRVEADGSVVDRHGIARARREAVHSILHTPTAG